MGIVGKDGESSIYKQYLKIYVNPHTKPEIYSIKFNHINPEKPTKIISQNYFNENTPKVVLNGTKRIAPFSSI